ncbi:PAS domain-containing protein [Bradyrhizobium sp. RT5a]
MIHGATAWFDREVAQRRSAQARLSDALENSREGIVLLDANGHIALVNSRATEFIGCSPQLASAGFTTRISSSSPGKSSFSMPSRTSART